MNERIAIQSVERRTLQSSILSSKKMPPLLTDDSNLKATFGELKNELKTLNIEFMVPKWIPEDFNYVYSGLDITGYGSSVYLQNREKATIHIRQYRAKRTINVKGDNFKEIEINGDTSYLVYGIWVARKKDYIPDQPLELEWNPNYVCTLYFAKGKSIISIELTSSKLVSDTSKCESYLVNMCRSMEVY